MSDVTTIEIPENTRTIPSPTEAFAAIGSLMTAFSKTTVARFAARAAQLKTEQEGLDRIPFYDLTRQQKDRWHALALSLRKSLTMTALKNAVPGLKKVLDGSEKMDTGAAFMLIGTYADLTSSADVAVSDRLVELVMLARPKVSNCETLKRKRSP